MILNEYNQFIREAFDISDEQTRRTIISLDEAEENQLLSALTNALYDKIVQNVDKIDFGSIPKSRGDITKVQGFQGTLDCLNIMRKIVLEYREDPAIVDTVLTAIENIKSRKGIFVKSYAMNVQMPMITYNLMVLAIEQATSLMISVCIQYIKDPASKNVVTALDKVAYNNTMKNMMYEQLYKFNQACASGQFDNSLDYIIKNGGKLSEGTNLDLDGDSEIVITISKKSSNPVIQGNSECDPEFPQNAIDDCGQSDDIEDIFDDCDAAFGVSQPVNDCDGNQDVTKPIDDCGDDRINLFDDSEDDTPTTPIDDCDNTQGITRPINDSKNQNCDSCQEAIVPAALLATGAKLLAPTPIKVAAGLGLVLLSIPRVIIPFLRGLTYYFYHLKASMSENLAAQSQFLQANAYQLQNSIADDPENADGMKDAQKTINKQLKIADKLKVISNKLAIKDKKAEKAARKMIHQDERKMRISDMKDIPDVAAKSMLF